MRGRTDEYIRAERTRMSALLAVKSSDYPLFSRESGE